MRMPNLSVKEAIIYSALPSGYTNATVVENYIPSVTRSFITRTLRSLCDDDLLLKCSCHYRSTTDQRTRTYDYFRITPRGIRKFFPSLSMNSVPLAIWSALHSCSDSFITSTTLPCNSRAVERNLRVLEVEQFCSSLGVRTTMDFRPGTPPSAFGFSVPSAIDQSCAPLELGEAIKLYREAVGTCAAEWPCEALAKLGTCEAGDSETCEAEEREYSEAGEPDEYDWDSEAGDYEVGDYEIEGEPYETDNDDEYQIEDWETDTAEPDEPWEGEGGTAAESTENRGFFDTTVKAEENSPSNRIKQTSKAGKNSKEKSSKRKEQETGDFPSYSYDFQSEAFRTFLMGEKNDTSRFTFFRSREVGLSKTDTKQDLALIRSCFMGILVKGNRIIMLYNVPRSAGLIWNRTAEERAMQNALVFCNSFLGTKLPSIDYIKEAIIFYRSDREMISTINGTVLRKKAIKYEDFGAPFQKVYGIPFSLDGREALRLILEEDEIWRVTAEQYSKDHPDFEVRGRAESIYPLSYFGAPVMQAYPFDVRALARHMTMDMESREQVCAVNAKYCRNLLEKTVPEVLIYD